MPCGACRQNRSDAVMAVRRLDIHGVARAAARAISINVDKARGVDVDAKYMNKPTIPATPYKRPPDRSE